MSPLVRCVAVVVVTLLAGGLADAGFNATDVFVASTGRGPGSAGSQWYTTVWVHNPQSTEAHVQFSFLLRNQANPATPYVYSDTIPAGSTRRFDNAVENMFGLTNAFGAVRVVADVPLMVNSRIYTLPSGGEERDSVGQFFAAVPASFAVAAGRSTRLLGVYQTAPAETSPFRYNYGFVETTGGNVTVQVTVHDAADAVLGSKTYDLGPYEVRQYSVATEFPSVSTNNGRLLVAVTSGPGAVVAFGSGLANRSNDPSTFEMAFDGDLLAAGLSAVAHDATLTGDGSAGSPLGLADDGVGTAKLADGAVTQEKIAAGAIASAHIADLGVATSDLANDAVTRDKLAAGAVGSAEIGDFAVTNNDLATGAVTGPKILVPLTLAAAASKTLELGNNYGGGLPGATLRVANSSTAAGVAAYLETNGSDVTLALGNGGSGPLFKAFGGNGGEDEFRIDNNGTVHIFGAAHAETIKLDAVSGTGTFKEISVSGHADASLPIAYGTFNTDGTKFAGTANISASWDVAYSRYLVTIAGEPYSYNDYVTVVTPNGTNPRTVSTGNVGSQLTIYIFDPLGNKVQNLFHVVVFKP